jgi:hypothetical protein
MFQWQREVTALGLCKGRFAFFEGCGLGKSVQQLEWGYRVHLDLLGMLDYAHEMRLLCAEAKIRPK